ncbi:hypothetical protein U1Q18_049624 [Sarracenia purpurea var. burkii]
MNNLVIVTLIVVHFEHKRTHTPMQPRDIISDILGPPLRGLTGLLAGNLYALSYAFFNRPPSNPLESGSNVLTGTLNANGHQIGLGNGSTLEPLRNIKVAEGIPVQRRRRIVFVEGENGNILVNGIVKYYDDEMLNNGEVHIRFRDGNFYVNNNLVLKKNPFNRTINPVVHSLDYENVSHFTLKIDSNGFLYYIDNNRPGELQINYRRVPRYLH